MQCVVMYGLFLPLLDLLYVVSSTQIYTMEINDKVDGDELLSITKRISYLTLPYLGNKFTNRLAFPNRASFKV